jgi:surfactin synthase thioesterase subunit
VAIKLIAISYAGGSSFSYSAWRNYLPSSFALLTPDYAGHGKRFHEPLAENFENMVLDMYWQVVKDCAGSVVLYGHSLGAMIAVYTAQHLYQQNKFIPRALILAACRGPEMFKNEVHTTLSDDQLLTYLINVRSLPYETLESREFKSYVLPGIRNDFRIANQFECPSLILPPCPVLCINGKQDYSITDDAVNNWQKFSSQQIKNIRISGNHFFLEDEVELTCRLIIDYLEQLV